MATGCGQPGSSIYRRADGVYDFPCTPCEEGGYNSEAVIHCQDCRKHLCSNCESHHKQMYMKHDVLVKSRQSYWPRPVRTMCALERCSVHQNEALTDQCIDHEQLCCQKCKEQDHSSCARLTPINELANRIKDTREYQSMFSVDGAVASRHTELSALENVMRAQKDGIGNSAGQFLADVQALQDELNQRLDKLKADTMEQIKSGSEDVKRAVEGDIQEVAGVNDSLGQLVTDVKAKSDLSDKLAYIGYEKCKEMLRESEGLLMDMEQRKYRFGFQLNSSLSQHMELLNNLGEVTTVPTKSQASHQQVSGGKLPTIAPLTEDNRHAYSIRIPEDTRGKCEIAGMCQVDTGEIVVIDKANGKVKALDNGYSVVSHANVPGIPQDVCHIAGTQVAIAINDQRKSMHKIVCVKFTDGTFTRTRTLQLEHDCYSIDHHEGLLYVGDRSYVYIYTTTGARIFLPLPAPGIRHFSVRTDGQIIHIANYTVNEMVGNKPGGNIGHLVATPDNANGVYVCSADGGQVFMARTDEPGIYQMMSTGDRKFAVLAGQPLIDSPASLCLNRNTRQLVVGQASNDEIVVFDLQ